VNLVPFDALIAPRHNTVAPDLAAVALRRTGERGSAEETEERRKRRGKIGGGGQEERQVKRTEYTLYTAGEQRISLINFLLLLSKMVNIWRTREGETHTPRRPLTLLLPILTYLLPLPFPLRRRRRRFHQVEVVFEVRAREGDGRGSGWTGRSRGTCVKLLGCQGERGVEGGRKQRKREDDWSEIRE
jgi:hypothetical protein